MMSSNINRLKIIAAGLGDLCRDVVFVGGSVAELYADDPAATDIRPTMDVDCVIELATYGGLQEFEDLLRRHGFVNDIESGVICRWKYNGETVDIMPDRDSILGFTNQWYRPGFQHREIYELPDGTEFYIMAPLYYLATKIEATRGRGGDDLRFMDDEFNGSPINGAFTSELGDFIADSKIKYWIYGHSHRNISRLIGNTRCVCNQLGYVRALEHLYFKTDAIIEL